VLVQALRLHQQKDFDRLRQSGQVARQPALMLSYMPNDLGHNRYGFIIAKRIQKTAVGRNRLKRQLRAGLRTLHPQLRPGYDLVWIARPALTTYSYGQITQALGQLVQQAGLWQTQPLASKKPKL
jgi:ribonuclease P protein component